MKQKWNASCVWGCVGLLFVSGFSRAEGPNEKAHPPAPSPKSVVRGPYLQNACETRITVCWRTAEPQIGRVHYGKIPGQLLSVVQEDKAVKDHQVELTGLEMDTEYYYAISSTDGKTHVGGEGDYRFKTNPKIGTAAPTRVWIIGDPGEGSKIQKNVYQAYVKKTGDAKTDVWLQLGDNAYSAGTDEQFQKNMFDIYPEMLRNTSLWSTRGNHETHADVYYNIYNNPTHGEAGGVASGSEAFYSFDYGRTHFICLDSLYSGRKTTDPMYLWLESDLIRAQGKYDWIIAFWHHPPYTHGSHNSDTLSDSSGAMFDMRQTFLPLLEAYGIDAVFTGHSHCYERSVLMDGHYGTSDTYDQKLHAKDIGDGDPSGDGAYTYVNGQGSNVHHGTVYTVAGSSGKLGKMQETALPFCVHSLRVAGSVILEIDRRSLKATFLTETGNVEDSYEILHKD